ncbi:MAG: hypothetical protein JO298_02435 [Verrucomicrobia bacterium]|nr:hypothetical protein [Verrucomicrobiota bacterium]
MTGRCFVYRVPELSKTVPEISERVGLDSGANVHAVLTGATEDGTKELFAVVDDYRESANPSVNCFSTSNELSILSNGAYHTNEFLSSIGRWKVRSRVERLLPFGAKIANILAQRAGFSIVSAAQPSQPECGKR